MGQNLLIVKNPSKSDKFCHNLHNNDLDKALADFNQALLDEQNNAEAHNARGRIHFLKNDLDGAIADYAGTIRSDPSFREAYRNRSLAYRARKKQYGVLAGGDL
jgi:tetratricopeptide (TPR) repeat protein